MLPNLGEIKKQRRAFGLTQKDLALNAGISQSMIAKIESGRISPGYDTVKKIFTVFENMGKDTSITARQIMSRHVISVRKSNTVSKAIETMRSFGYSQLPVLDKNQVIGTISEKAILDVMSSKENLQNLLNKKTKSVMTEALPRINENESIDVISALLKSNSAVLVTKKGKVIGIITKADLFKIVKRE